MVFLKKEKHTFISVMDEQFSQRVRTPSKRGSRYVVDIENTGSRKMFLHELGGVADASWRGAEKLGHSE
jgi:hypothetical protein